MLIKIIVFIILFLSVNNIANAETLKVFSSEGDGQIATPENVNWDIQRNADIGTKLSSTSTDEIVSLLRIGPNSLFEIYRAFLAFDTSVIPDNAVVTSASLHLFVGGKHEYGDENSFVGLYKGYQDSVDVLENSDINNCGESIDNPTPVAQEVDISTIALHSYFTFDLNLNGLSWISKDGYTKLCLRDGHDVNDVPLVGGAYTYSVVRMLPTETPGTSRDPYMVISYFLPEEAIENPTNLSQKRVDGVSELGEGDGFVGNGVVFGGEVGVDEEDGLKRGIEVEVKRMSEEFDGVGTHASELGAGSEASVLVSDFFAPADLYNGENEGDFKWRARTIDEEGNVSQWVEFGDAETDFGLKAVPLMTQVPSIYPDLVETTAWSAKDYAFGSSTCGTTSTIKGCGCALASLSTIGRFHGILSGTDDSGVNPDNLNEWLKENNGYDKNENINWTTAIKYFGKKEDGKDKQFLTIGGYLKNQTAIENVLSGGPIVAKTGPAGYVHYITLDSALDSGYEISDPYWFNTHYTNQDRNYVNDIQDYDDTIVEAMDVTYHDIPVVAKKSLEIHLASPAEFVVTDSAGNKFGYDPRTNTTYESVASSDYWHETQISSGPEEAPKDVHVIKYGWVLDAVNSPYTIEVIGTGSGEYDLSVLLTEEGGESTQLEFASSTNEGEAHTYFIRFAEDWTEGETLLKKFIEWVRLNIDDLPNGFIPQVVELTNSLDWGLQSQPIELNKQQSTMLENWDSQPKLEKGWNFVQGILKSF